MVNRNNECVVKFQFADCVGMWELIFTSNIGTSSLKNVIKLNFQARFENNIVSIVLQSPFKTFVWICTFIMISEKLSTAHFYNF